MTSQWTRMTIISTAENNPKERQNIRYPTYFKIPPPLSSPEKQLSSHAITSDLIFGLLFLIWVWYDMNSNIQKRLNWGGQAHSPSPFSHLHADGLPQLHKKHLWSLKKHIRTLFPRTLLLHLHVLGQDLTGPNQACHLLYWYRCDSYTERLLGNGIQRKWKLR